MFKLLIIAALSSGIFSSTSLPNSTKKSTQNLSSYSSLLDKIPGEDCQTPALKKLNLSQIEGVKLNTLLLLQTTQIIKEARAASKPIAINSSFRTCAEQTALRSSNCPAQNSPAESCLPPTEKPGQSLHNYGLAIDFKCEGYPIFGSSPCYTWLTQNAERFKLKRHTSEPWHWSFTGK